jgi:predicted nucleic acid-binding protein
MNVICNAGPLIALGKLNRLELLADAYGKIQITRAVYAEVVTQGLARGEPDALVAQLFWQQKGWPIVDVPADVVATYHPPVVLGTGETEVLALAQTLTNSLVLLDDELARTEARRLSLQVRGTLGVLVQAYHQQHLTYSQIELLLQEIASRPDIWISAKLCQQIFESLPEL